MKRQFGTTAWQVAPLGLALRAARTALICGEFGSTIERMLGEALATGCELLWLDIPPARDDIAFGNAAAPFDSATADLWKWLGAAVRTARASDHVITAAALAPITAGPLEVAFPVEFVQRRVEQVLTASGLDVVPLVQLQVAANHARSDRYWGELHAALQRLSREGKVMHWGVAVAPPPRQPVRRPERERQSDHDEFIDDFPDLLRDDIFFALAVLTFLPSTRSSHPWCSACSPTACNSARQRWPTHRACAICRRCSAGITLVLRKPRAMLATIRKSCSTAASSRICAPLRKLLTIFYGYILGCVRVMMK